MVLNNHNKKRASIAILVAIYVPVSPAQDSQQEHLNNTQLLETITVTSQKRVERLIDVPIAVTNVSRKELSERGIKSLRELSDVAPNLTISQGSDFSSKVIIRGVGANSRNIGFDSRVGIYIDGVYLGQSPAINQSLIDLDRLEVLRGPQGSIFGKNTIAGAINLVSQAPSDEFEGAISVTKGNFSRNNLNLKINTPVSDSTGMTFFLNQSAVDGYIENRLLQTAAGEGDETAGRIVFKSKFTDALTFSVNADYATQERIAISGTMLTDPFGNDPTKGPFGDILQSTADEKFASFQDVDSVEDKSVWGASITVDYDMGNDFSLKSITSQRKTDMSITIDVDRSPLSILNVNYRDIYSQTTQELQLISPNSSNLTYILGVYLFDLSSSSVRDGIGGDNIGVFGDPRLQPGDAAVILEGFVDTTSYAFYTNVSYEFDDKWEIGTGLRYSSETKKVDWNSDGANSGFFDLAVVDIVDERTDTHLSPAVNLSYAISESSQAYARLSTGFKSGGYNLDFISNDVVEAGIEFDKETVTSFEFGYKAELLQNNLRLNTSLFSAVYEDYQVNQYIDLGGGRTAISITNAAEVNTQGFELEVDYQVTPDLMLTGSVGFLKAIFDSFPGGGTDGIDASGNTLPDAPELTMSLGFTYYQGISSWNSSLFYRLDYHYTDEQYFLINNDENYVLPDGATLDFDKASSFTTLNARISLIGDDNAWAFSFYGRNLTDSDHMVDSFREFFGGIVATYARPRTYGIELSYNF